MIHSQNPLVVVVVLGVVLAVRLLSSQRRKSAGRSSTPPRASGFAATTHQGAPQGESQVEPAGEQAVPLGTAVTGPAYTGTAPGWFTDPFVRHEQRYWSGAAWTEHVLDQDIPALDPPPTPRAPST
ncbi:MAG: DUF2510 domain-containing protein [Acidimicrobiales bacterium]